MDWFLNTRHILWALVLTFLLSAPLGAQPGNNQTSASLDADNEAATLFLQGETGIGIQVTGTHDVTLSFQTSVDNGLNWVALNAFPPNSAAPSTAPQVIS